MKNKKIYIAGPLFTEAERNQRLKESKSIKDFINENRIDLEIFSPLEDPKINSPKGQPGPEVIFKTDYDQMSCSNVFFFDLSNSDSGTMIELGIVIQRVSCGEKNIKIYSVESDFRAYSNNKFGLESTYGTNMFLQGALKFFGYKVYKNFEDAFKAFKKDFIKK